MVSCLSVYQIRLSLSGNLIRKEEENLKKDWENTQKPTNKTEGQRHDVIIIIIIISDTRDMFGCVFDGVWIFIDILLACRTNPTASGEL